MLKLQKNKQDYFLGDLNYQDINEKNEEIFISHVHSFSETGFYIDWYMKGCGCGQYSMGIDIKTQEVVIGNECMGLKSCKKIVKAFEKGLTSENNPQINYMLEKIKYNFSPDCRSLEEGLVMLWKNAKKDECKTVRERKEEKESIKNVLILGDLTIYKFKKTIDYFKEDSQSIALLLNIDLKWSQFGDFIIIKDIENGISSFIISEGLKVETIEKVIEILDNINPSELENFYVKKEVEYMINIKKEWNEFKNECNLTGLPKEIANTIMMNKTTTSNYYMI